MGIIIDQIRKALKVNRKGEKRIINGLEYTWTGHYWSLTDVIYNNIDRFHTYSRNN